MKMTVFRKKREVNKGRGESRNASNIKKLEKYLELNDIKSIISDNRELRSGS